MTRSAVFVLGLFSVCLIQAPNAFAKKKKAVNKTIATEVGARRFGSFESFMGKWDCQGTRTDYEKAQVKDSKFIKDTMTFSGILNDQWVSADYEDSDGYVNRCYYSQLAGAQKFEQVCVSSQEGLTLGEANATAKNKIEFTGETSIRDKKLVHKKTIERVALGALDFNASIEDPATSFKREWKALCFFRRGELVQ